MAEKFTAAAMQAHWRGRQAAGAATRAFHFRMATRIQKRIARGPAVRKRAAVRRRKVRYDERRVRFMRKSYGHLAANALRAWHTWLPSRPRSSAVLRAGPQDRRRLLPRLGHTHPQAAQRADASRTTVREPRPHRRGVRGCSPAWSPTSCCRSAGAQARCSGRGAVTGRALRHRPSSGSTAPHASCSACGDALARGWIARTERWRACSVPPAPGNTFRCRCASRTAQRGSCTCAPVRPRCTPRARGRPRLREAMPALGMDINGVDSQQTPALRVPLAVLRARAVAGVPGGARRADGGAGLRRLGPLDGGRGRHGGLRQGAAGPRGRRPPPRPRRAHCTALRRAGALAALGPLLTAAPRARPRHRRATTKGARRCTTPPQRATRTWSTPCSRPARP